jgi:hypothetical protein
MALALETGTVSELYPLKYTSQSASVEEDTLRYNIDLFDSGLLAGGFPLEG